VADVKRGGLVHHVIGGVERYRVGYRNA
jgi:hypothetical protein